MVNRLIDRYDNKSTNRSLQSEASALVRIKLIIPDQMVAVRANIHDNSLHYSYQQMY